MKNLWGQTQLHDEWPPVERQVGLASLRVLFGFWVGIFAIVGTFWTMIDISKFW
ncbi:hypothetical protein [Ponticaulis sp.]|uniref:hypothetical protein n=1 Tax=Ponticaulis sp. TaxID=2020902 RepID=UPI0025DF9E09|nr:hypothetical protein [Ponticaulis sp.]|tara:strand:+ start:15998 stop:16159 length:162 start_codon:yes stop_codon:yes gene_type:complete